MSITFHRLRWQGPISQRAVRSGVEFTVTIAALHDNELPILVTRSRNYIDRGVTYQRTERFARKDIRAARRLYAEMCSDVNRFAE